MLLLIQELACSFVQIKVGCFVARLRTRSISIQVRAQPILAGQSSLI